MVSKMSGKMCGFLFGRWISKTRRAAFSTLVVRRSSSLDLGMASKMPEKLCGFLFGRQISNKRRAAFSTLVVRTSSAALGETIYSLRHMAFGAF